MTWASGNSGRSALGAAEPRFGIEPKLRRGPLCSLGVHQHVTTERSVRFDRRWMEIDFKEPANIYQQVMTRV